MNKLKRAILLLLIILPFGVNAASATTGFNGNNSVYVGNNIELTLFVRESGSNGGLAGFGGTISYDSSKLKLVGTTSLAPYNIDINGNKIAGFGQNAIKGYSNIMKFTFNAIATGTTSVSYSGGSQPDANASPVSISGCSKTISIVNPPSGNNNLSSLSVSNGNINFNKNTTSYSITVDSSVTSVNVSAQAEDSGASISGTGNIGLNYGNNTININVRAANGSVKTYSIHVNRKDNRSDNNNLSSITVNGGNLEPNFNSNTLEYNLSVPYSVSDLSINAVPSDSKSRVSITGQNGLIAEEVNDVKIHVTAENGSIKTYVIHVKRGKDPNKVLSTNNYLASLTVSVGLLSPEFDREKELYVVYLPYEVDSIEINATVEDTRYGILNVDGPSKLSVGNNEYQFSVTAENEEVRTYKVIVVRAASLYSENNTDNTYLKELRLENGKLSKNFDKNVHLYEYTKKDNFNIIAIPEDENSNVSILEKDGIYVITVESSNSTKDMYILVPKDNLLVKILVIIGIVFTSSLCTIFVSKKLDFKKIKKLFKKSKK